MGATKTITLRDIIQAIKKDGYKQATATLLRDGAGFPVYSDTWRGRGEPVTFASACAIGQAAVNLGVDAEQLNTILGDISFLDNGNYDTSLRYRIVELNDRLGLSCGDIAEQLEAYEKLVDMEAVYELETREYVYGEENVLEEV